MSYTITCDLLNELMGLDDEQADDHTEKWKRMRKHFNYMTDDQFADMYRTCFDSDGLVCVCGWEEADDLLDHYDAMNFVYSD